MKNKKLLAKISSGALLSVVTLAGAQAENCKSSEIVERIVKLRETILKSETNILVKNPYMADALTTVLKNVQTGISNHQIDKVSFDKTTFEKADFPKC